jgi:hypothetical protein
MYKIFDLPEEWLNAAPADLLEWPRLLWTLRGLMRWIGDPRLDQLSPYMLASEARSLMDELEPSFLFSGVSPPGTASAG